MTNAPPMTKGNPGGRHPAGVLRSRYDAPRRNGFIGRSAALHSPDGTLRRDTERRRGRSHAERGNEERRRTPAGNPVRGVSLGHWRGIGGAFVICPSLFRSEIIGVTPITVLSVT